jgi:hypothetical protein
MVAMERIEKLKQQYTDKYVVVDGSVPELARFASAVGQVKTVNMSGRALVEFDQYANIGWYDIELDFLKVVPKPEPKPAEAKKAPEKAAAKPAAEKPAAANPAAAGKQSTADILAAARAKKGTAPAAAPAAKAAPVEAPATKSAPAAKPAGAKPSTADILAAARGKGAAPAAAAPVAKKPDPKPAAEEPAEAPEAVAEASVIKAEPAKKAAGGPLPTTTAEKIAYCRKVDAKG